MRRNTISDDRGQAHTVEAFIAALLLVTGLLFAMQATAVTPLSASTSNQHIENQQRALAGNLLSTAAEDGSLQEAVLYWNTTSQSFIGSDNSRDGSYRTTGSENEFLDSLNRTLGERRIAYNVQLRYHVRNETTGDLFRGSQPMVQLGQPSDNAVTAARTVTLYNDSRLSNGETLEDRGESFYAPSIDDGLLYNRVEVRITTWRM